MHFWIEVTLGCELGHTFWKTVMHFWTEVRLGCELGHSFWRTDAFLDRGAIKM